MHDSGNPVDHPPAVTAFDVVIGGAGPAGLCLALECVDLGLRVACVDPNLGTAWPNQYGAWYDEWASTRYAEFISHAWEHARFFSNDTALVLERRYARVHGAKMKAYQIARLQGLGAALIHDRVLEVHRNEDIVIIETRERGPLTARLYVNACGAGVGVSANRNAAAEPPSSKNALAWQIAWGEKLTVARIPEELAHDFCFMDFRYPDHSASEWRQQPSFLYAMPFDDTTLFVEETSLAASPPMSLETLRARLHRRLDWMGVEVIERLEVERCRIPMNLPLPRPTADSIPWGAAAGMIHPATGYMLSPMVRRTLALARAIARELDANARLDAAAMRRLHGAVWPRSLRKAHDLYEFGLAEVLTMDADEVSEFFRSFLSLPQQNWATFIDGARSHREVTAAMFRLLIEAPASIKARLVKAGFRRPRALLNTL